MIAFGVRDALRAVSTLGSGTLVRRSSDGHPVGVVYVERRRICWGRSSAQRGRMSDLLLDGSASVTRTVLEAAIARCRDTRQPFGEFLVHEGVVSRTALRDALLRHTCEALRDLDRITGDWEAKEQAWVGYDPTLTFSAADLLAGMYALEAPDESARLATVLRRRVLQGQRAFALDENGSPIAHAFGDDFGAEALFELGRQARELTSLGTFARSHGLVAVLDAFACAVWRERDVLHVIVDDDELAFNRLTSQLAAIDP